MAIETLIYQPVQMLDDDLDLSGSPIDDQFIIEHLHRLPYLRRLSRGAQNRPEEGA